MADTLPENARAIKENQVLNIKVGGPLISYDQVWNRIPEKKLIANGNLVDKRGYWHDPKTPYSEDRGDGHSPTFHAAAEKKLKNTMKNLLKDGQKADILNCLKKTEEKNSQKWQT